MYGGKLNIHQIVNDYYFLRKEERSGKGFGKLPKWSQTLPLPIFSPLQCDFEVSPIRRTLSPSTLLISVYSFMDP